MCNSVTMVPEPAAGPGCGQAKGLAGLPAMYRKLDARVKLVAVAAYIAAASHLASPRALGAALALVALHLLLAAVPPSRVGRVLLGMLPFAAGTLVLFPLFTPGTALWSPDLLFWHPAVTVEGLHKAVTLSLRLLVAGGSLALLLGTTAESELLQAMAGLGVPAAFVQTMSLTWRYLYVLADEVGRMRLARQARLFRPGRHLGHRDTLRVLGQLVGMLWWRSLARGERVYAAMLARGYGGRMVAPQRGRWRPADWLWGGTWPAAMLLLWLWERGSGF